MKPCRALMAYNGDYKPGDPIVIEKETFAREDPVEGIHSFVCQNPACGKTFKRAVLRRKYCSNSCAGKMRWAREKERNGSQQEASSAASDHRRAEAAGAPREAR
jgi:hypothetical protein